MDVANQIRQSGTVTRGWLGVIIQEVTMELAESFGMEVAHGALVTRILPDSPASQSSLQVGDVITHFEDNRIERSSSLPPLVGRVPANSDAKVRVAADRAGIVEGDVISMVDNKPVDSARDLGNVLQDMGDRRNVAVLVHRAEGPVFLALQIEK